MTKLWCLDSWKCLYKFHLWPTSLFYTVMIYKDRLNKFHNCHIMLFFFENSFSYKKLV